MLNKYLNSCIFYISIEKNLSEGTIDSYRNELIKFLNFIEETHDINCEEDMVKVVENEEFIKSYLFYLVDEKKNKKATIMKAMLRLLSITFFY